MLMHRDLTELTAIPLSAQPPDPSVALEAVCRLETLGYKVVPVHRTNPLPPPGSMAAIDASYCGKKKLISVDMAVMYKYKSMR